MADIETAATTSPVTARAVAFVAEHKPGAEALGTGLAEYIQDPDAFAAALRAGLEELADPEYHEGQQTVAPGLGPDARRAVAAIGGGHPRLQAGDAS